MIRLAFLWHMHQPFYKDLVSGEYRLPWVRLHALKDYYGMVKLLDEFPAIHQTFNLVPSLLSQLQDYVRGEARDPFLDIASKPPALLTSEERRLALHYLFQANLTHVISRYPRYRELYDKFSAYEFDPALAERQFSTQDYADLQVLSQLAWFDEFFLDRDDPQLKDLLARGRDFTLADQRLVLDRQIEILASVIPAYASAAQRGIIEISTSPFYHPILPLICDTGQGAVSSPGLPLPAQRFQRPEDARVQLQRALDLHDSVFGMRPRGVWPSEGSVSEEVLHLAQKLGVRWMATDEGVLGRSLDTYFHRSPAGVLDEAGAAALYNLYRFESGETRTHLVFRDHSLSDLIGFVYAGVPAEEAAFHFIQRIKECAQPMESQGKSPLVSIILDGENAWESFSASGRQFLRTLYRLITADPGLEAVTISEAMEQTPADAVIPLKRLVPGSWINSNFNVWIGAPEDNRAWDYLYAARELYDRRAGSVDQTRRKLAFEELLIAEGSDWNWWYGPEHSSANDRDFDELYRKHLSNVYHALGEAPPEYLAQPISIAQGRVRFHEQTTYIHPRMDGASIGYFDWIGAAHYKTDVHGSAMHGKVFLLDSAYAGIDQEFLYCRLDFTDDAFVLDDSGDERLKADYVIALSVECRDIAGALRSSGIRFDFEVKDGSIASWQASPLEAVVNGDDDSAAPAQVPASGIDVVARVQQLLEVRLPLDAFGARIGDTLHLRFSIWKDHLPLDALPAEGALALRVATEDELNAISIGEHWTA